MSKKLEEFVRLSVFTPLNQKEISKEIKVTEQTISNWKKTEEYEELKRKYEREYLSQLTPKALKTLSNLLNAKSEYVRLQTALAILDRTGFKELDPGKELKTEYTVIIDPDYGDDENDEDLEHIPIEMENTIISK